MNDTMKNDHKPNKLIRSLIELKHQCQHITNKKLTFPLPAKDILLLNSIDLRSFQTDYQNILINLKKVESDNENLKKTLDKFPIIVTNRYENSITRRVLLLLAALLFFFPIGIYIYYLALSRRGELKLKLIEIISVSHQVIQLIEHPKDQE